MIMIVMVLMTVILIMLIRSQPGESPASYAVQGLMDFLVSKHKIAQELREKLIFNLLTMEVVMRKVNPAGVLPSRKCFRILYRI